MFGLFSLPSRIALLQAQIADLQKRLDRADKERKVLLDRLLAKNNIEPVSPPEVRPEMPRPVEVLHPFGVLPPEAVDAVRESWVREEMEYIEMNEGVTGERARALAEQRFSEQHRAIH